MKRTMRLEATRFPNVTPAVVYEVDAGDTIVAVNDAWRAFAKANGGAHLMPERVLGRWLWDFICDDTTRLVYDVILRQVRGGARSRFEYRCDSPRSRRLMEMSIVPGAAGHVIFESTTLCEEWHHEAPAPCASPHARKCGWCKRIHGDDSGCWEFGLESSGLRPGGPADSVITDSMCWDCYRRVMNSVDGHAVTPGLVQLRPGILARTPGCSVRPVWRRPSAAVRPRRRSP